MKIYIVIPAHNEEEYIGKTLNSLLNQTSLPDKILVVNDNSTDQTSSIIDEYKKSAPFLDQIKINSSIDHLPGSKVIHAFYQGYDSLDQDYDIICKFDADLIFPPNYLETIVNLFSKDPKTGMIGGVCYIEKDQSWVLENLTNKDHIRGALKAYRKDCFKDIGGLKKAMGWDTVDELLAKYHGWKVQTDPKLIVKHLKPTGHIYNKKAKYKQGSAFYRMRYGFLITLIASLKLALLKRKPVLILDYLTGFWIAKKEQQDFLVTSDEGVFIRNLRWKNIWNKLLSKK